MTAHSQPVKALGLLSCAVSLQSVFTVFVVVLRPFASRFANFLEVVCSSIDVTTLVLLALAYRRKLIIGIADVVAVDRVLQAGCCCSWLAMLMRCECGGLWECGWPRRAKGALSGSAVPWE
jgi:hypothetical protein